MAHKTIKSVGNKKVGGASAISYQYLMPNKTNDNSSNDSGGSSGLGVNRRQHHLYSDEEHHRADDLESLGTVDQRLLEHHSSEPSHSLQNDFDEIRELLKNTATLYNEAAKLHMEQTRQISDILTAIRLSAASSSEKFDKLTAILMLRSSMKDDTQLVTKPPARTKTPERITVPQTLRTGSRKSQVFSGNSATPLASTHTFIPTVRSKSTTRNKEEY